MLFNTSFAVAFTTGVILVFLSAILVIAYVNSVTEKIPFKEAFRRKLISFMGFVKKETSPSNVQVQQTYNPVYDIVLANSLRNQLSVFDNRAASLTACNAGTFSSYNIPCIQMDFCPKHDTKDDFPAVRHSLESVTKSHFCICGIPLYGIYSFVQNIQQGFYYIYILYAITPNGWQALQNYYKHLKKNAILQATAASAPIIDKALGQDLSKGIITQSNTGTTITIGFNLEHRTAIRADISQTGHICIVGGTGSGKSMLTLYLLYNIFRLQMPVKLYIGDFKKSGDYKGISDNFAEFDGVVTLVDNFYKEFEQTEEDSTAFKFLLLDEYAGFIIWLAQNDKKKAEEIKGKISNLLMLGRSRHCYVWCIQQRISAQLFPSGIGAIDNFQICIGLGRLSVESRKSLFAAEHMENAAFEASFNPKTGEGLCLVDGQPLVAIGVPYIKDKDALKALLANHAHTA